MTIQSSGLPWAGLSTAAQHLLLPNSCFTVFSSTGVNPRDLPDKPLVCTNHVSLVPQKPTLHTRLPQRQGTNQNAERRTPSPALSQENEPSSCISVLGLPNKYGGPAGLNNGPGHVKVLKLSHLRPGCLGAGRGAPVLESLLTYAG